MTRLRHLTALAGIDIVRRIPEMSLQYRIAGVETLAAGQAPHRPQAERRHQPIETFAVQSMASPAFATRARKSRGLHGSSPLLGAGSPHSKFVFPPVLVDVAQGSRVHRLRKSRYDTGCVRDQGVSSRSAENVGKHLRDTHRVLARLSNTMRLNPRRVIPLLGPAPDPACLICAGRAPGP